VSRDLLLGAVAYDPKVVTIWDGFRTWLREQDVRFDYILYSNYERQVEDLVAGRIGLAWNSPLAWYVPPASRARPASRCARSRCAIPTAT
jgi:phosphonate transport system substrate-binding protein